MALAAFAGGVSAVKTSFELIKALREAVGKPETDPNEIQARLAEIQAFLLDAREKLSDSKDENDALQARIKELERYAQLGQKFEKDHGVYWIDSDPYCPICWDVDRKPVRLGGPNPNRMRPYIPFWTCALHKVEFQAPERHQSGATISDLRDKLAKVGSVQANAAQAHRLHEQMGQLMEALRKVQEADPNVRPLDAHVHTHSAVILKYGFQQRYRVIQGIAAAACLEVKEDTTMADPCSLYDWPYPQGTLQDVTENLESYAKGLRVYAARADEEVERLTAPVRE